MEPRKAEEIRERYRREDAINNAVLLSAAMLLAPAMAACVFVLVGGVYEIAGWLGVAYLAAAVVIPLVYWARITRRHEL